MRKAIISCFVLWASFLGAAVPAENLHKDLVVLFEKMLAQNEDLVGKEYTMDLTLKFGSDRFLIFSDAYIQADEETRYQIAKWKFTPDQTQGLEGKSGVMCRVTFEIEEVLMSGPYSDIPHFIAKISSLQELKK